MNQSVYDIPVKTIAGQDITLNQYAGKVLLLVNVASKCGLTPQYKGLQEIYDKYKDRGFEILGFPCNQFANQEPGDEESIKQTCYINYGVTFPMFAKIDVNGDEAHPIFKYLKKELPGLLVPHIKWNFTKFLIDREGKPVKRFAPKDSPASIETHIEKLLSNVN